MKIKFILFFIGAFLTLTVNSMAANFTTTLDSFTAAANPLYRAESGLQTGRIARNTIPSSCGSLKANPGTAGNADNRRFDKFEFVALSTGCVTVTLNNSSNELLFVSAYNQSGFDPANVTANYLGDAGDSPRILNPSRSFSFNVSAGQVFTVVVNEVDAGGGIGQNYTLDVSGVKVEPDFSVTEALDLNNPKPSHAAAVQTANQTGRITINGQRSDCSAPKANPGAGVATGIRRADVYRFTPFFSGCATVTVSHKGNDYIYAAVYNQNGYDPTSPTTNYLADSGNVADNNVKSFSFVVQKDVPVEIVVVEFLPGQGSADNYTLNISGVKLAPVVRINGKLDTTVPAANQDYTKATGIQNGILNRNSTSSVCGAAKTNPGLEAGNNLRRFDRYTFTPSASGCVEVTLRTKGNNNLFTAAYNQNGFTPASPSANYIADPGKSPTTDNPEVSFSFNAAAGVPFSVVVHEMNTGIGIGQDYVLEVKGQGLNATRRAAPYDFDGDQRTDVSIFRPDNGEWWYLKSSSFGNAAVQFGVGSDRPVAADFTGDGVTDVAFWRPSTGYWYILRSEDNSYYSIPFGQNNDIPVPGDYDGDGRADTAVFRPSDGVWYISNSGGGTTFTQFGLSNDIPLARDYDGDYKTDLGVYRPSTGEWYYAKSSDNQVNSFQFGTVNDRPVPADYTGDGLADIAFFRPSNEWYVLRSEDNSFYSFAFGIAGDKPTPGDYDGDGTADVSVFRPASGVGTNTTWYFQRTEEGFGAAQFGNQSDTPLPGSYYQPFIVGQN